MKSPTITHFQANATLLCVSNGQQPLSSPADARRTNPDTMEARLLALLHREWVSPLEALGRVGCLSLSQRCGTFARQGYPVQKRWVDLPNGKRVMSYRIAA